MTQKGELDSSLEPGVAQVGEQGATPPPNVYVWCVEVAGFDGESLRLFYFSEKAALTRIRNGVLLGQPTRSFWRAPLQWERLKWMYDE